MAALTAALYGRGDRYEPDGRAWLANPGLVPGASGLPGGWELEGPPGSVQAVDGGVRLSNLDPDGVVGLRQVFGRERGDAAAFDVTATVAAEGIAGGRPGWRPGRVTVAVDAGPGAAPPRGKHVELAVIVGSREPRTYRHRYTFGSRTRAVEVAMRLRTATGALVVRDLSVTGMVERPGFRARAAVLRAAWAALFAGWLWLGLGTLARVVDRIVLGGAAIATAAVLLLPVHLRHALTDEVSRRLLGGALSPDAAGQLGHVGIFLVVGWFAWWLRPADPPLRRLLPALVLLAGAAELAQYLADARSPSLEDWACNALGAALGMGLGRAWGRYRARRADDRDTGPRPAARMPEG